MDIAETWLQNFKEVVAQEIKNGGGKASIGYRAVEEKTGIAYDYIYQLYTGKPPEKPKRPTLEVMRKIEAAYGEGKPPGWINTHHYTMTGEQPIAIDLHNNKEYPAIRRVALKASAGVTGYAVEFIEDDGPPIVFRADWYSSKGYKPEKMLALRVTGESMYPSLDSGDLIVVNTEQTTPKDGIAFVANYDGEIVVKRLVRESGQWWLTSDNQDQRRYPRKVCDSSTTIIGEVVYRQTERI